MHISSVALLAALLPQLTAVEPPGSVSCTAVNSDAVSISFTAVTDADIYAIEFALDATSILSVPLASAVSFDTNITVDHLSAQTSYWFKVRAHSGPTGAGTDSEWSAFSSPISCTTTGTSVPKVEQRRMSAPASRYQLMYRISEVLGLTDPYVPPDFLHNHDSASILGSSSFLTFAKMELMASDGNLNSTTITEYCVEMLDVPWADYVSCPAGGKVSWGTECTCASSVDRIIQHQDVCTAECSASACTNQWEHAIEFKGDACVSCGNVSCAKMAEDHMPLCTGCDDEGCQRMWASVWMTDPQTVGAHQKRAQSHAYPSSCNCTAANLTYSLTHPGTHKVSWPPGEGAWFSTPAKGDCGSGNLGDNDCTWKSASLARIIYGFELAAQGFTRPVGPEVNGQNLVDRAVHVQNGAIMQKVFDSHHIQRTCGPSSF